MSIAPAAQHFLWLCSARYFGGAYSARYFGWLIQPDISGGLFSPIISGGLFSPVFLGAYSARYFWGLIQPHYFGGLIQPGISGGLFSPFVLWVSATLLDALVEVADEPDRAADNKLYIVFNRLVTSTCSSTFDLLAARLEELARSIILGRQVMAATTALVVAVLLIIVIFLFVRLLDIRLGLSRSFLAA